jgi:phosphosulfolactate synthase
VNDKCNRANVPPSFLTLPQRSRKPRAVGLTHVLDKGTTVEAARANLATAGAYVDLWKLGWGTAYVDPRLPEKLDLLRSHGIRSCLGGTLLEIAWTQGRATECLDWAADVGLDCVEVSRGVAPMHMDEKHALLRLAADRFTVLSEVGRKDPEEVLSPDEWSEEVAGDLAAGAHWVITEGRESGTVGIYRPDGSIRADAVAAVVRAGGIERVLFEAPRKDQQAWLVREFGPDVNLANIPVDDVLALETLRLGLRADTFEPSRHWQPV